MGKEISRLTQMEETNQIKKYIGEAFYDGQLICGQSGNNIHLLLEPRGWSQIQKKFPDTDEAIKFQDNFAQFVVDAINEKLESYEKH